MGATFSANSCCAAGFAKLASRKRSSTSDSSNGAGQLAKEKVFDRSVSASTVDTLEKPQDAAGVTSDSFVESLEAPAATSKDAAGVTPSDAFVESFEAPGAMAKEDAAGVTPSDSFVESLEGLEMELTVEVEIQSHWMLRPDVRSDEDGGSRSSTRTIRRRWDEYEADWPRTRTSRKSCSPLKAWRLGNDKLIEASKAMISPNDVLSSTYTVEEALQILGLQKGARSADVHAAFRRRALQCHPDKVGCREPYDELLAARAVALQNCS
eukprot:TRINITY_DN3099_c0_g1_i2.p1 TRINITY_DN3099_c0_g1~~TRINITY_DN3099_c0_g1_i2.p1  ORF type:complete len:267 (+),score=61.95 TRINITY_DN3099_c0_g1_i2:43-843(+)